MNGFFASDHQLIQGAHASDLERDSALQALHQRFEGFVQHLAYLIQLHRLAWYPLGTPHIRFGSVCDFNEANALSAHFSRSPGAAVQIERLMGRESITGAQQLDLARHPLFEVRLQPDYCALELILTRNARWDQENFAGRLAVARHRESFFDFLGQQELPFRLGFWHGAHLSEMHLRVQHFRRKSLLHDWFSTFEPSRDNLRLGLWYAAGELPLDDATLVALLKQLYHAYELIIWASENNFRPYYAPKDDGEGDAEV